MGNCGSKPSQEISQVGKWYWQCEQTLQSGPVGSLYPSEGHSEKVHSAQFGPDGQKIVSASKDKTVRVWSAKTAL